MTAPLRRRWFRFSLRTLFVLVAVLGVFLGWLGVQVKWIRDRHEALSWVLKQNGLYSEWRDGADRQTRHGDTSLPMIVARSDESRQLRAPWALRMLGEPSVTIVSFWEDHVPIEEKVAELHR